MAETIQFSLSGMPALLTGLRRMSERLEKKTLKHAVKAAADPIAATMKSNLSAQGVGRTFALQKSIGVVTRSYQGGQIAVAVVGVRRGFGTTYRGRKHEPTRIAHLIEGGHEAGGWSREMGGQRVAARPFARPAMDQHRAGAQAIFAATIRSELQQAGRSS